MSIQIKINDKPNLKKCIMNCDDGLHDKLNNYELTKFINSHSTNLFLGKPKSGKTSLMYSFFKSPKILKSVFHKIYIFQPSASRGSMVDKIFDKLPEDQLYEELTYDNLKEVIDKVKNEEPTYQSCLILDDMTAYLKDKETLKIFKEMVFNRRHLHLSIYVLSQSWFSVPKDIRKMFNNLFIFKVSKNELENIFEEVVEEDKDYIQKISKIVYDEPFQYLFINTETQRMFRGFDELIL